MDDEEILARGGTEDDIRKYAEQNGASLTKTDVQIQDIREKVIAANPEEPFTCGWPHCKEPHTTYRTIRLADVLLAMRERSEDIEGKVFVSDIGEFVIANVGQGLETKAYWNLLNDDLEKQSPETIDFIHSLLCI